MRLLLPTLLLIVLPGASVFAQSSTASSLPLTSTAANSSRSATQDDDVFKKLEQATDRLALAEAKNALLEEKLLAKDDRIAAKDERIKLLEQQKADLLSANKDRRDAGNIDAERLSDARMIITKQDAEIAKLRNPGFFSSLFDRRTAYGGIVGFGVCKLTTGSNPTIQVPNPFANSFQLSADDRARQAMRFVK